MVELVQAASGKRIWVVAEQEQHWLSLGYLPPVSETKPVAKRTGRKPASKK